MHELDTQYNGRVDFLYIDREDPANAAIVEQYQIRTQPVFILLDADGNIAQQWFGVVPQQVFIDSFESLIN